MSKNCQVALPRLAYEIVLSNLERKLNKVRIRCELSIDEDIDANLAHDILHILSESKENILSQLIGQTVE